MRAAGHRRRADSINLTQFCRGKLSTAQTLDSDYAISEDDVGDLVNSAASMATKTLCCHLHAVMDVFPSPHKVKVLFKIYLLVISLLSL